MSFNRYSLPTPTGRWLAWTLVGGFAAGLAGCSNNPVDSMTFYPVKGKVLLTDGKPLTKGNVAFVATQSTLTSSANLESDGTFTVKGSREGLPPGEYKVRIETDESAGAAGRGKPVRRRGAGSLPFPEKYLDEDASGLTATVKPGDNNLEFTLKR